MKHSGERQFDLVIGADGLHSTVRRLAFGAQQQFEKNLGYVVAAFEARGYRPRDEDVYLMYGQPGRMIGRFTLHDDRTLFLFVFAVDGAPLPAALDQQKAMLREKYAAAGWECRQVMAQLDLAAELYFDRVSQIRMRSWSRGRIALVGDAAFCVSLLAGQGSALAMLSAYVLAGELAQAGGRYQQAFDNYETRLRGYIETKQQGAERFAGAFAPKTRWRTSFPQPGSEGICDSRAGKAFHFGREIIDRLELSNYRWPMLH